MFKRLAVGESVGKPVGEKEGVLVGATGVNVMGAAVVGLGVSEFAKCESLPVGPFCVQARVGVSWVRLLDRACHLYSRNLSSTAVPAEERKRATIGKPIHTASLLLSPTSCKKHV